jgi:hypothetical protein
MPASVVSDGSAGKFFQGMRMVCIFLRFNGKEPIKNSKKRLTSDTAKHILWAFVGRGDYDANHSVSKWIQEISIKRGTKYLIPLTNRFGSGSRGESGVGHAGSIREIGRETYRLQ